MKDGFLSYAERNREQFVCYSRKTEEHTAERLNLHTSSRAVQREICHWNSFQLSNSWKYCPCICGSVKVVKSIYAERCELPQQAGDGQEVVPDGRGAHISHARKEGVKRPWWRLCWYSSRKRSVSAVMFQLGQASAR